MIHQSNLNVLLSITCWYWVAWVKINDIKVQSMDNRLQLKKRIETLETWMMNDEY